MEGQPADFRISVLLSFQRALWDQVTPSLRGVAVRLAYPLIASRFIYEVVGDEEEEIAQEVGSYVVADFRPPVDIDFIAVSSTPGEGRDLEAGEEWVFLRKE